MSGTASSIGSERELTGGELKELFAAFTQGVPIDLPPECVRRAIAHKGRLNVFQRLLVEADLTQVDELVVREALGINPYANEQCSLVWHYPKGYAVPTLEEQAEHIGRALGFEPKWTKPVKDINTPIPTDGVALWPCLSFLGELWDIEDPRVAGYGKLVAKICNRFGQWSHDELHTRFVNRPGRWRMIDGNMVGVSGSFSVVPEVLGILTHHEGQAMAKGNNCLAKHLNLGDWRTDECYSPRNILWQSLHWSPSGMAIEPVAGLSIVIGTRFPTTRIERKWFPGARYMYSDGLSDSPYLDLGGEALGFGSDDAGRIRGRCGSVVAFTGV